MLTPAHGILACSVESDSSITSTMLAAIEHEGVVGEGGGDGGGGGGGGGGGDGGCGGGS